MGYIYIDTNFFHGWSSDSCVGQVDSNGYIYNDVNFISGWGSGSCIGRVDYQDGFVYDDKNVWSGWASSACKGFFDKDGFIYNDKNTFSGFSSSACVGQMDSNGYVYSSTNYLSGWASGVCVGRADGIGEAAVLLLIILPKLRENSASAPYNENRRNYKRKKDDTTTKEQKEDHSSDSKKNSEQTKIAGGGGDVPGFIIVPICILALVFFLYAFSNRSRFVSQSSFIISLLAIAWTILLLVEQSISFSKLVKKYGWKLNIWQVIGRILFGFFLSIGYEGVIVGIGTLVVMPFTIGSSSLLNSIFRFDGSYELFLDIIYLSLGTIVFSLYGMQEYYRKRIVPQYEQKSSFSNAFIVILICISLFLIMDQVEPMMIEIMKIWYGRN